MHATAYGVRMMAAACVWSKKGASYFASVRSSAALHDEKGLTHFEDNFSDVTCKEIHRISACCNSHEFLPSIDEHDRAR